MSSESEQEAVSLKDRLKAILVKAGLKNGDGDDQAQKKYTVKQCHDLGSCDSQQHSSSSMHKNFHRFKKKMRPKLKRADVENDSSSEDETPVIKSKPSAVNMVTSDPDSDDSSLFRPQSSAKRKVNVSSSSDGDASDGDASDGDASDGSSANSSDQSQNMSDDDGTFLDLEAEEVSCTESGTPDEEGEGDLLSSSENDWESDWLSEAEDIVTESVEPVKEVPGNSRPAVSSGFASDSSDGSSEKCPICLLRFTDQEIGTPESCDHSFCAECLQQWSKNVNTCPVDRLEFELILVRRRVGGKVVKRIPVERQQAQDDEAVEDLTYCEICGQSDREDRMLLCDGCDLGFHMECLDPPLTQVPFDEWFCSDCAHNNSGQMAEEVDFGLDEVHELLEDAQALGVPATQRRVRVLPRTRQLERIRRSIQINIERRLLEARTQPSTSSGIDSQQSVTHPIRRRKTKKRKTTIGKKRKTATKGSRKLNKRKSATKSSKKKTSSKNSSMMNKRKGKKVSSCKIKRKKHSCRQSTRMARVVTPLSVKGRLAEQLGMRPPRQPWQTIPDVRSTTTISGISVERSRAGIPTLHIFGQRDQLDYFSGSDEEVGGDGGVAAVHHPRSTLSLEQRMHNRKRLLTSLSRPALSHRPQIDESTAVGTTSDLVDSILKSQAKMFSKKTDVKINIDGSLDIKLKEPTVQRDDNVKLQERLGENHVDVRSLPDTANGHIVQAPMYPGSNYRRGGPGMHPQSYGGGRRGRGGGSGGGGGGGGVGGNFHNSGFRASFNNPENSRAQYEQFLGNNVPSGHPPRARPLSFRLNVPRRPFRRNAILRRGVLHVEEEEEEEIIEEDIEMGSQSISKDGEDNAEGPKEDEDVDIYSDIEADSRKGTSEAEDCEPPFGALLPPPEPPAILMNLGDQNSDDEASDSELVIDDRAKAPTDDVEEKYDPAEPCDDSDEDAVCVPKADEIPLPPGPEPPLKVSQLEEIKSVVEYSDDSQSIETILEEKDEIEEDHVSSSNINSTEELDKTEADEERSESSETEKKNDSDTSVNADLNPDDSSEEDDDDCPNFSIYSATSVSIAREVGEKDSDEEKDRAAEELSAPEEVEEVNTGVSESEMEAPELSDVSAAADVVEIEDSEKKATEESLLEVDIENSEKKELEDSAKDRDETEDSGSEDAEETSKGQAQNLVEEIFGLDEDSLAAAPLSAPVIPVVPGLEGLETEIISDGEEAMLDGDLSDPETVPDEKRTRKRSYRVSGEEKDKTNDVAEFEDGEIVDEAQRERRERRERERREKEKNNEGDENVDISKSKESGDDDKRKKRRRGDRSKDRAPLSSSENKTKEKDKDKGKERDKEKDKKKSDSDKDKTKTKEDISWKKPSKSTKDRNYRDGKEKGKDERKDDEKESGRKERKKKEKRKDLERYDVRKVLSDKTLSRQNKDAFGRDLDTRRRTRTRSRSRSRSRSKSRARSARGRSRSRSRSHRRVARSRSRSRSRARSVVRSRLRHRSLSRGRSKSRRSRSRSRFRSGIRSRSRHRSLPRSRDRHRKSRSKERARRRSREPKNSSVNKQRNRSTSASRERRREVREREQLRPPSSWSRSWSRSWSPSLSGSPQYPASETLVPRSFSRSWSRDRVDHVSTTDMVGGKHKTHKNLTVIVTNNKEEGRRKRKESKRGSKRRGSPAPSKEVFASGDNILVSVNFKSNKNAASGSNAVITEKSSKRKRDEGRSKRSKKDKSSKSSRNEPSAIESTKPPEKRRKAPPPEASQKPVAIIDLEQSPYREYTPSPKDLIVLSDSDDDINQANEQELQQLKQLLLEESAAAADDQPVSTGPKTPPEPQIKFSISAKNALRSMNNPLMDEEEEEEEEEIENEANDECADTEMEVLLHKGPNTPPESPMGPATPGSSPTSPDAYDPFEPTKSRSASPDEGAGSGERPTLGVESLEEPLENGLLGMEVEDEARPKTDTSEDVLGSPQKGDGDNLSPGTTAHEADESEKAKQMSPTSSAEAAAVKTPSKAIVAAGGSTEVTSSTSSSTSRPTPQRSIIQSDRILATVNKGASVIRPTPKPGTPAKILPRQNGESSAQTDVVDMDLDSPYSPASSEGDDLFEPPPVYSSKPPAAKTAPRPKAAGGGGTKSDKFDVLFGSSPMQRVKYGPNSRAKAAGKNAGRNQAKLNKIVKHMAKMRKDGSGGKAEEDQIKILDEVPSSAVEMQVKDKFLKKLNRQERVVEEVKLALKPHYYKKHINKDDYKEILRRSVPKICHNRSGDINPIKIRTLVEAYVKKIRYLKKKATSAQLKIKSVKKQGD